MGLLLNQRTCVAVGRFNPAILVPDWIVKQKILPKGQFEMLAQMGSNPAAGSSTVAFTMCGLQWRATLARLDVTAEVEGADPGEFVAEVLTRLEHTPLRAVGSNFEFTLTDPDGPSKLYALADFGLLKRLESAAGSPALSGMSVAAYSHEDAVARVSLSFERSEVVSIDFNFNRDSLTAKDAAAAARRWSSDKAAAHKVLQSLIGS
jgi:hypothetical protein